MLFMNKFWNKTKGDNGLYYNDYVEKDEEFLEVKCEIIGIAKNTIYSDKNKTFESLPYEVLSLKNTSYEKIIDFLPYNVTGHRLPENFGSDIILLKKVLMAPLESIDKVRMELSNLKISLKNETENNRTLIEQLREWGH